MKIVEDYNEEGVPLYEVAPGELFSYEGSYFMKGADPDNILKWEEEHKEKSPAMDMATGELCWVSRNATVPPIYARIRINGRAD